MFKYISKLISKISIKYKEWKQKTNPKNLSKMFLELETGLLMLRGKTMEFPTVMGESPSEVLFLDDTHPQRWILRYDLFSFEKYYILEVATETLKGIDDVKIRDNFISYRTNPNRIEILETFIPNLENPILGKYVLKDI